jgi:hypothetical protein
MNKTLHESFGCQSHIHIHEKIDGTRCCFSLNILDNGSVQKYFSAPLLLLTPFSLKKDFLNGGSGQATKIGDSKTSISSRLCAIVVLFLP